MPNPRYEITRPGVTASAPATRAPQPAARATVGPAPGAPSAASANLTPGVYYMPQDVYLGAKADPAQLKRFLKDWVAMGGRGIIGGDGKPASYWDVYQDLAASGIDVGDLPTPESLPQGQTKGGGGSTALSQPAAGPAAAAGPQQSPELTSLLSRLGVDYPNAPAATPALLAFLRGLGMNLSTAEDTKAKSLELIGNRSTTATEDINREAARSKTNVTADLIRRGVLSSGEATGRFARGEEDKAAKLSNLAQSTAEGSAAAESAYRMSTDSLRQQALEKVMETEMEQRQREGASAAQADAYRQQQEAADIAHQREQEAQRVYREWVEKMAREGVTV